MRSPKDESSRGKWLKEYFSDPNRDEDSLTGKFFDAALFRRLLSFILPFRKYLVLALVALFLSIASRLVYPLVFKVAVDSYISADIPDAEKFKGLYICAFVIVLAFLLNGLAMFGQTVFAALLAQRSMHELRMKVFRRILSQSMRFFSSQPVGRLLTRTTNDVNALNDMIATSLVTLLGNLLIIGGSVVLMFSISWRLALLAMAVVPFLLVITAVFRRKVRESYRLIRWLVARINAFLAEHLSGMRIIQLFRREEKVAAEFRELNHDTMLANIRQVLYSSLFTPSIEALSSIMKALLLYQGGIMVLDSSLEVGALIAFFMYFDRAIEPVRNLAEQYNVFQGAMASSERIFRVLDTPCEIEDAPDAVTPASIRGKVEFKDVWFAYEGDEWVLKDVNLTIEPGESVAVVGATGAGKTSLIKLLCRFYDVQRGAVLVDGTDVRKLSSAALRSNIVVVPQDVFLFSDTVLENIRLWDPSITREDVERAAAWVNADAFIRSLPDGYDTVLRERAAGLSVGQKQLLSFARALAHDPPILVLDEATSSIDPETEALIQDALRKLMRGRTSIVIAHRLSTVRDCDRIVVMHKGRIRETGTHEELIARDGIYRKLYEIQYKSQNLAAS